MQNTLTTRKVWTFGGGIGYVDADSCVPLLIQATSLHVSEAVHPLKVLRVGHHGCDVVCNVESV